MDFYEPVDPRRKRRWIGPVVVLTALAALVVTAFLMAEYLVRTTAQGLVAKPVVNALNLKSTDDVAIDFGSGSLILQLVTGSINELTVSASSVPFGSSTAEVSLIATGVPLDTADTVDTMSATATLDKAAVQSLATALSEQPLTLTLGATTLNLESSLDVAGQPTPVVLEVAPTTADGSMVFRVVSMTVGGEDVSVDAVLSGAYGPAAAGAATPPTLCVAQFLPSGLTIESVSVSPSGLVIEAKGAGIALASNDFTTMGRCALEGEPAA
jgi:hypothetical protein